MIKVARSRARARRPTRTATTRSRCPTTRTSRPTSIRPTAATRSTCRRSTPAGRTSRTPTSRRRPTRVRALAAILSVPMDAEPGARAVRDRHDRLGAERARRRLRDVPSADPARRSRRDLASAGARRADLLQRVRHPGPVEDRDDRGRRHRLDRGSGRRLPDRARPAPTPGSPASWRPARTAGSSTPTRPGAPTSSPAASSRSARASSPPRSPGIDVDGAGGQRKVERRPSTPARRPRQRGPRRTASASATIGSTWSSARERRGRGPADGGQVLADAERQASATPPRALDATAGSSAAPPVVWRRKLGQRSGCDVAEKRHRAQYLERRSRRPTSRLRARARSRWPSADTVSDQLAGSTGCRVQHRRCEALRHAR